MAEDGRNIEERDMAFIQSGFQKAELLPGHELKHQLFEFKPRDIGERKKALVRLCLTDILLAGVQIIEPSGGENALHSHAGQDEIFFVLKGRVHFYGEGDLLIGDLRLHQGILIPRGFKYWLRAVGEERVELLQMAAFDRSRANKHTTYGASANKENTTGILVLDSRLADAQS